MTTGARPYAQQAQIYLAQARDELEKGDVNQAAEKGWGAAAEMVKAVAQRRGWPHGEHSLLVKAIGQLVEETRNEELTRCFNAAGELHRTFYEGHMGHYGVSLCLRQVETLVDTLSRWA